MATFVSATAQAAAAALPSENEQDGDAIEWVNKGHTGKNPNEEFDAVLEKYGLADPWDVVDLFEKRMAAYAGSKYAVSVDNCTDAMFLCLKYDKCDGMTIKVPSRTYCSVPCTIINAGCKVAFDDTWEWSGLYKLAPTRIVDGACCFRRGMYEAGTLHCMSFHIRKHLPIGKGGMILTDEKAAYDWFRVARYEGRHTDVLYKDDAFDMVGWNMYMPPEDAAKGLQLLEKMGDKYPDMHDEKDYRPLSEFACYSDQGSRMVTVTEMQAMEKRIDEKVAKLDAKLDAVLSLLKERVK